MFFCGGQGKKETEARRLREAAARCYPPKKRGCRNPGLTLLIRREKGGEKKTDERCSLLEGKLAELDACHNTWRWRKRAGRLGVSVMRKKNTSKIVRPVGMRRRGSLRRC